MTSDISTALGPGAEFDAIRDLLARFGDVASGVGDDAAVLDVPRGDRIVVSTDACVENRHFRAGWLSPEEIGYRAVTAALSDLAAMAARPLAVLWAVNLPDGWRPRLPAIADGVRDAARVAGARIVGGNLSAAGELSLTTTVMGIAFRPLHRGGATAGQTLYVTGSLGGPAAALAALQAGEEPRSEHRERFARPAARIAEARWLARHGATAAIDLSDGIAGDARHLAAASNVGMVIHLDRLPLVSGVDSTMAVRGGEEYEIMVTAGELDTREFQREFGLPLSVIGEVTEAAEVVFLDGGRPAAVGPSHDHLARA